MRVYITLLFLLSLITVNAQYICDNGNFESPLVGEYLFEYDNISYLPGFTCGSQTGALPNQASPLQTNPNNFSAYATFVNSDNNVYGGADPSLFTFGVTVPRVYEGNYSMKLNDTGNPDRSISVMSKTFFYEGNNVVSYKYFLVSKNIMTALGDEPRFIVRVHDLVGNTLNEICLQIDYNDTDFQSTDGDEFLYLPWTCGNIVIDDENIDVGQRIAVDFIIADDRKGAGFSTVYIDDICNVECGECLYCIQDYNIDVLGTTIDTQQAQNCITAINTLNNEATAIYHAGKEVVLKPDFEALHGSAARFYIEDCDSGFAARQSLQEENNYMIKEEEIRIFPNPASGTLNIIKDGYTITGIQLYSSDGKLILEKDNNKSEALISLDISNISKGLYLLNIKTSDGTIFRKQIIKD